MVFTVEFSVRAAMIAVYQLCGVKKKIPKVSRYDIQPSYLIKALIKSFRGGVGVEVERWRKMNAGPGTKILKLAVLLGVGAAATHLFLK